MCVAIILSLTCRPAVLHADVRLAPIFGSHMVLQQGQPNRIWGWADPSESIEVSLGSQKQTTQANDQGKWQVKLDSLPVGGPHVLTIAGKNRLTFEDVLVGE